MDPTGLAFSCKLELVIGTLCHCYSSFSYFAEFFKIQPRRAQGGFLELMVVDFLRKWWQWPFGRERCCIPLGIIWNETFNSTSCWSSPSSSSSPSSQTGPIDMLSSDWIAQGVLSRRGLCFTNLTQLKPLPNLISKTSKRGLNLNTNIILIRIQTLPRCLRIYCQLHVCAEKSSKKCSISGPKQKTMVGSNQLEAWTRKSVQPEVSVTKITMKVGSRVGIGFALTHFIQAAGDLGWLATTATQFLGINYSRLFHPWSVSSAKWNTLHKNYQLYVKLP